MKKEAKKSTKEAPLKLPTNLFLMVAWVFSSVIVGQVIVGYPMAWILGADKFQMPVWTAVYSALSYIVSLLFVVLVPIALFKRWHVTRKDLGLDQLPTWTDIGLAPVGFIAGTILAGVFTAIFSIFPWFDAGATQSLGFSTYIGGFDRVIAFVTLVIVAPIAEEIIFRGWLYGLMRKETSSKMTNAWSMILSSFIVSLIFGLVHFQWNVSVNVFALSLVLCALREITGTINAGILVHILKNGIAFWLLYVMGIH